MNRRAKRAVQLGNQLSFEYPLANADDGLGWIANMLLDRQHELSRHRNFVDRLSRGDPGPCIVIETDGEDRATVVPMRALTFMG